MSNNPANFPAVIDLNKSLQRKALFTISVGFFMVSLDTTVVNVALQSLRFSLHTDLGGLQWVIDSYILAFAALLLSAGELGDCFGSKKVFIFGLLVFSIASGLCGMARSLLFLIIARVLQGAGSALLIATSLSLLQRIFVQSTDRARAFGVWGAFGGTAIAAGPVIGGFLVSAFGWRSVFLLNIPFGIAGLYMASNYIPNMEVISRKLKILSQFLSIILLGALAYTFIAAGSHGWQDLSVTVSIVIFMIFTIAFVIMEILSEFPMLPKDVIRGRSFIAAAMVGAIINFGFYGQMFVMSLYFQQIRGYSAIETGFAFLPQAIICAITAFFCGKVTAKIGPGIPMTIGLVVSFLGLTGLALVNAHSSYIDISVPMLVIGFGMSCIAPATISAAMASAPVAKGGVVSGIISSIRQSGSLLGVAVLGSLINFQHERFTSGMHMAFMISATFYILGLGFTIFWILPRRL